MSILKYFLSKSYRRKYNAEYTRDISSRLAEEERLERNIYKDILSK